MERVAVDTSFLIDLQNEKRRRGRSRGAYAFLKRFPACELFLPATALGEYLEGFENPSSETAQVLVATLKVLSIDASVAETYARVCGQLRKSGNLIGANDLWIGCTALAADLPILTRNAEHFGRIPELVVVDYSS